jgi:hypothetical protein
MARLAVMVALTLYPWVTGFAAVTACIESAEFKWTTGLTDRDQAKLNDHNAAIARAYSEYGFNQKLSQAAKGDYKTAHVEFKNTGCEYQLKLLIEGGGKSALARLLFRGVDLLRDAPKTVLIDWDYKQNIEPDRVLSDAYIVVSNVANLLALSRNLFLEAIKPVHPARLGSNRHKKCPSPICALLAAKDLNGILLSSRFRFQVDLGSSTPPVEYVGLSTCLANSESEQAIVAKPEPPDPDLEKDWKQIELLELDFMPPAGSNPCPTYIESELEEVTARIK